jgi:hypothetical protein
MSYRSRLYNHSNAQGPAGKKGQPFFSRRGADATAGVVVRKIQRLSTPVEDEQLGTNDARMLKDKLIQEKPMDPAEKQARSAEA